MENNFNKYGEGNYADGTPSDFAASAPEHSLEYGYRDPMAPVYPGPVITAPPMQYPLTPQQPQYQQPQYQQPQYQQPQYQLTPQPMQYPLSPQQYPAYYETPMQYPYPMRGIDAQGNEVEVRFIPLPPPFFPVPGPFFYPPRPFIFPIPPVPPFFI